MRETPAASEGIPRFPGYQELKPSGHFQNTKTKVYTTPQNFSLYLDTRLFIFPIENRYSFDIRIDKMI